MFSMPPATATSTLPSRISCAAETIACAPEPQTRLTVIAGTVTGRPAWTPACRAGFILLPACTTLPMTTVSDFVGANAGARDGAADRHGAERRRRHILEAAAEGADRGANRLGKDD